MQNNKNKNIFPLVLIFLIILVLVGGAYWYGKQTTIQKAEEKAEEQSKTKETTTSGQKNNAEEKKPVEEPVEDTNDQIIVALQELFAAKYSRKVEDAIVTISKREGDYVVGGIKFSGEMAGGYVLAAKVEGAWKIVFDGNGTIPCSAVDEVNFPSTLATECWDTVNNINVDRTE